MRIGNLLLALASTASLLTSASAFTQPCTKKSSFITSTSFPKAQQIVPSNIIPKTISSPVTLEASPDLEVVALVAGQENYGLAIVALGEALWSFLEAPSLDHAKVLVPATLAAVVLVAVSGPMVTSGDAGPIALGLEIATGVSVALGASYVARLLAPYSPSAKEIAFLGLLVAIAGFFSFSQNLVVDGFITLPSIPLPSLPSLPSIELPSF